MSRQMALHCKYRLGFEHSDSFFVLKRKHDGKLTVLCRTQLFIWNENAMCSIRSSMSDKYFTTVTVLLLSYKYMWGEHFYDTVTKLLHSASHCKYIFYISVYSPMILSIIHLSIHLFICPEEEVWTRQTCIPVQVLTVSQYHDWKIG